MRTDKWATSKSTQLSTKVWVNAVFPTLTKQTISPIIQEMMSINSLNKNVVPIIFKVFWE